MGVSAKQAFEAMVRENADMLRAFMLCLVRDSGLADELFQEAFVTAWKKLDTYDTERPFGAWVRGIAGTLALGRRRHVAPGKMHYFDQETLALVEVQFSKVSRTRGDKWEEKVDALRECMNALPRPALDVISMHYQRDHTCLEIANRLGIGAGVVKKRLQGSRKLLCDCVHSKLAKGSGT
jgi:RNA polymerase sigma factor (sigma-70 family)